MAQAIFKEWFVDFNFPGGDGVLVDGLPKGWRMGKLGEEFNITMGQSPKGETLNQEKNGMIFYQGKTDFGFRFPSNRVYTTEPNRIANKLETLVCVRAPVGDVNMVIEKCCIGRGLSAVIHKTNTHSYTYYAMKNIEPIFKGFESEGTVFGSLNKANFENIEIIVPTNQLISNFEEIVNSIDERILSNTLQIQTLTQLRDSLLPRLMSGKIKINKCTL
jgi:type I restriction enzyme S subunit